MTSRTFAAVRPSAAARVALLGMLVAAPSLGAQIINVPMQERRAPVTLTAALGFMNSASRFDGQSDTQWFLGEAMQYKLMLDYGLGAGNLGITGSLASQPIARSGPTGGPNSDGDIQLWQVMATFRTRDQRSAHQVIEVSMGLSQWANYSGTDALTAEEQEPRNAFALIVGYGIGFPFGERFSFVLVQELSTLWGSSEGLSAGQSRQVQNYTTRIGLRYRLRGMR